eukprot:gene8606-biopygen13683
MLADEHPGCWVRSLMSTPGGAPQVQAHPRCRQPDRQRAHSRLSMHLSTQAQLAHERAGRQQAHMLPCGHAPWQTDGRHLRQAASAQLSSAQPSTCKQAQHAPQYASPARASPATCSRASGQNDGRHLAGRTACDQADRQRVHTQPGGQAGRVRSLMISRSWLRPTPETR